MQCMLQNNRVEPLRLGFSFSEKVESCYLHGYSRNLIIYRAVTKGVTVTPFVTALYIIRFLEYPSGFPPAKISRAVKKATPQSHTHSTLISMS